MVCQLTIGVKLNPKQSTAYRYRYVSYAWRVPRQTCMTTNRRHIDVNWRVLEFSLLLAPRSNCPRNATSRTGVLDLWHSALKHTAKCQLHGKICSRNAADRAAPLLNGPRNATNRAAGLSPWHSAAHI
jgi:hypothetical protein